MQNSEVLMSIRDLEGEENRSLLVGESALEVVLNAETTGDSTIEIRKLNWGTGVGWCPQQTLVLTTETAEALLRTLQKHRSKWKRGSSSRGKVIPLHRPE